MQFEGKALLKALRSQLVSRIEIRSYSGRLRGEISITAAIKIAAGGGFVGVGNRRRIRYLRPLTMHYARSSGSLFTRRLDDGFGRKIAPPWIREHKNK
jgi:hypothetical protein